MARRRIATSALSRLAGLGWALVTPCDCYGVFYGSIVLPMIMHTRIIHDWQLMFLLETLGRGFERYHRTTLLLRINRLWNTETEHHFKLGGSYSYSSVYVVALACGMLFVYFIYTLSYYYIVSEFEWEPSERCPNKIDRNSSNIILYCTLLLLSNNHRWLIDSICFDLQASMLYY